MNKKTFISISLFFILTTASVANITSNAVGNIYNSATQTTASGNGGIYIVTPKMQSVSNTMLKKLNINTKNTLSNETNYYNYNTTTKKHPNKTIRANISFSEISNSVHNKNI